MNDDYRGLILVVLAAFGVVALMMVFDNENQREKDILMYTCEPDQYSKINFSTSVCELSKTHDRCLHDAVTSICKLREEHTNE
jgi:hypothetical protein